jgi:hypothetical protein
MGGIHASDETPLNIDEGATRPGLGPERRRYSDRHQRGWDSHQWVVKGKRISSTARVSQRATSLAPLRRGGSAIRTDPTPSAKAVPLRFLLRTVVPFGFDVAVTHDWAPNGRRIVFTDRCRRPRRVGEHRDGPPDGTRCHHALPSPSVRAYVRGYSPNGDWIVFGLEVSVSRGCIGCIPTAAVGHTTSRSARKRRPGILALVTPIERAFCTRSCDLEEMRVRTPPSRGRRPPEGRDAICR